MKGEGGAGAWDGSETSMACTPWSRAALPCTVRSASRNRGAAGGTGRGERLSFAMAHGPARDARPEDDRMDVEREVLLIIDETLSLNGRGTLFTRETPLLGAMSGLDSMTIVSILAALEERLGLSVKDGDLDSATFATVGSLVDFVAEHV